MNPRPFVAFSLLAAACANTPARPVSVHREAGLSEAARLALEGREANRLAASLANEVGPRLAGSPGDAAAIAWAERTMRSLGLANVHSEPVTVPVWQRGEERATLVGYGPLTVNALGWSGSTPAGGIEAEVVRVASLDDLAKLPDGALRDKIAFLDAPMERTADGSGYGRAVPARYRGQTVAAAKGALATLIRSVGTDSANAHTGTTTRGSAPGIPIGALSNESASRLAMVLAKGPAKINLVLESKRLPDAPSANVVGEIVGRDKPDEVVLLGAHLDSWDTGRGALDDGAGCGIVLAAMRHLAPAKPARTVRVVLFAAEENSRAGGTAYGKAHAAEADKIILTLEADGGTGRVQTLGLLGAPEALARLRTIAEPLAPLGARVPERKAHPGADIEPLVGLGVPTVDLGQDFSGYFDIHHTRGDTADKLDPEALAQVTAVVTHVALRAAEADASFGRVPPALRHDDD